MIQLLLISVAVSFVAYTYSQVLTLPDMILNRAYNYADRYWPKWLAYPVIVCFKCVAGQFSFWYYLRLTAKYSEHKLSFPFYSWELHILFVCFAIFLSLFYDKLFKWLTKN
jgi:H+/Cl- antiporter ClcA